MAYMNQEIKGRISPKVKSVLYKYGMKGSLSIRNHMVLVLKINSGKLNIIDNWFDVVNNKSYDKPDHLSINHYYIQDHFSGKVREFLLELYSAMNDGNWNKSDIQVDYFDVGWYVDIHVGTHNKPYELTA